MNDKKKTSGTGEMTQVAGNGLMDRRLFLQSGITFSLATFAASKVSSVLASESGSPDPASPPWMHTPGSPFSIYGKPSRFEDDVVRFPSANSAVPGNGVSWTPLHKLEGIITPNGLHYERHHNGVPDIDPDVHQLLVHGRVEKDSFYSMKNLLRYPMQSRICFIECGGNSNAGWNKSPIQSEAGYFHGLVSCSEWTGVPLRTILNEVKIKKGAKWIIAEGADAFAMNISIPLELAMEEGLLVMYQNGERLRPENGYPLRLVLPGLEGVLNVKWLRRLKSSNRPVMARNETSKYTELQPSGKARMFTFVMEAKSIITSPSSNMRLHEPGLYQISGLAWSGNGLVKKVEVSADDGKSWADAELQGPVLPKSFTRFRIPWQWNGKPALIKSRVTDETGYVQPDREKLVAERGRNGFFHYNAIVSWKIDEFGVVSHTYPVKDRPDESGEISIDAGWD